MSIFEIWSEIPWESRSNLEIISEESERGMRVSARWRSDPPSFFHPVAPPPTSLFLPFSWLSFIPSSPLPSSPALGTSSPGVAAAPERWAKSNADEGSGEEGGNNNNRNKTNSKRWPERSPRHLVTARHNSPIFPRFSADSQRILGGFFGKLIRKRNPCLIHCECQLRILSGILVSVGRASRAGMLSRILEILSDFQRFLEILDEFRSVWSTAIRHDDSGIERWKNPWKNLEASSKNPV